MTFRIHGIIWAGLLLVFTSCAYFNTFYNAEQYFEKGEALRLEKAGESVPSGAREAYKKVIAKTSLVLEKYPDSRYVYPALLLQGKARFYRGELVQAEQVFRRLYATGIPEYVRESRFWLGMIKWKRGQPNPALQDLMNLLKDETSDANSARIYLAMAEIHLEIGHTSQAIDDLEQAARLTRNSAEREQIYYRLAELSLNGQRYDEAIRFYKSVVKNSLSKRRILEANLQIVKIYRLKGDLKTASNKIKSMLADERFKDIYPDLELELAKLYQYRHETELAMNRLETITNDYRKTPASAEAYYLLGEQALKDWDLDNASKYFGQVGKEDRQSPFLDRTRIRIKEVTRYQKLESDLEALKTQIKEAQVAVLQDTVASDSLAPQASVPTVTDLETQLPVKLSDMAELEAFHFNKPDSAISKLERVYDHYPDFADWPKAAYTLSHLLFQKGDSARAEAIRTTIVERYPRSEFAEAVLKARGGDQKEAELGLRMVEAEHTLEVDTSRALDMYRSIFKEDTTSRYAPQSMYFLAYFYDRIGINPDSAAMYYLQLGQSYPESEQVTAARDRIKFYQDWLSRKNAPTEDHDSTAVSDSVAVQDSVITTGSESETP